MNELTSKMIKKRMQGKELKGLGGWLGYFQLRIYLNIVQIIWILITMNMFFWQIIIFSGSLILFVLCLVFFYQYKISFRIVYIGAVISLLFTVLVVSILYNKDFSVMLWPAIIEIIIISALFKSQRVKNTFCLKELGM